MTNSVSMGVAYSDPAISGGTIDNTPIGSTTASTVKATTVAASGLVTANSGLTIASPGTLTAGGSLAHTGTLVGFYGKVATAQRTYSSAVHASSAASVSSSFGATQLAILQELQDTMIALGIWATA